MRLDPKRLSDNGQDLKEKLDRALIGQYLIDNNLTDADDKVAALNAAYQHLVKANQLQANPELEREKKIAEARTPQELRDALGYQGNALWGR